MKKPLFNTIQGFYFDTRNTISAPCDASILEDAMQRCDDFNHLLSKTIPGSDVWRVNHAEGCPVQVNAHTMNILRTAAQISEASHGAFNIALGPAIALWRFKENPAHTPDPQALIQAVALANDQNIILGEDTVTVPPTMQIDLGGIAKGYIADCIADELRARGVKSALLNFGGNVVTIGAKPDGTPWTIGLQTPDKERDQAYWAAVKCVDGVVVTSGVYERGFNLHGVRYHHILDPRTGWPVQNGIRSVTICTQRSLLADALTTALFVLGTEEGMQLAYQYNVQAVYLLDDQRIVYTQGMDILFVQQN
jgi:thiamine biosynthesis lipoprotein